MGDGFVRARGRLIVTNSQSGALGAAAVQIVFFSLRRVLNGLFWEYGIDYPERIG